MANFQEAVRQGNATGFVQSVTRQNKRKGRCAPVPHPCHEFLEDNEEDLAHAEVRANLEWLPGTSSRGRNRQPKPLARDVSGIKRLILTIAKIHLFAYAISEGAWQTRVTFLLWAEAVYYATWMMELPTVPFVKPPHKHLEIMVNALATMRGKCKGYLRSFVEHVHQFMRRIHNQQVIQENLRKFNLLFPNNFHCLSYCPQAGHYENLDVGHAIASMLFHSPGSIGNMFPDYFVKMPLPMVAYVLSIWQFCIEEWSSGTQWNGDLGMAAMSERFEANMKEVAQIRAALPDTDDEEVGAEPEIEADVQMGDRMSVEELNAQLFETARQESIRKRMREITACEQLDLEDGELGDDDEPRSPPLVPNKFNEYGYVTAHSKGKGQAN
ncbi:hypothetical protein FRC07_014988 [Ceratobasidium sp. 392]|nr:hypothetical protein FRC07_014988 [Ceratobasidium sp. 392]